MTGDYEWTLEDVREAKRRAQWKRLEWSEARDTARAVECEYWTSQLVSRFPSLEHRTDCIYLATISFAEGDEQCRVRGPIVTDWGGCALLVWRKASRGSFRKNADRYDCEETIPFIKEVRIPSGPEVNEA